MKSCRYLGGGGGGGGGGVITKSDYFLFLFFFFWGGGGGRGAFLNILGLFKVKIQNGIFLDSKISNTFGCACIPVFFLFFFLRGGGEGG